MDLKALSSEIDSITGLNELEKECMNGLMQAFKAWLKMERQHPDEMRDFIDPLHRMQDLLAVRVVRRIFPDGWPTHKIKPAPTPIPSAGAPGHKGG
jgi:hypothetical protein